MYKPDSSDYKVPRYVFDATLDWTLSLFGLVFQIYFDSSGYPASTFTKSKGVYGIHLKWLYLGVVTEAVFNKRIEDLVVHSLRVFNEREAMSKRQGTTPAAPMPAAFNLKNNKDDLH